MFKLKNLHLISDIFLYSLGFVLLNLPTLVAAITIVNASTPLLLLFSLGLLYLAATFCFFPALLALHQAYRKRLRQQIDSHELRTLFSLYKQNFHSGSKFGSLIIAVIAVLTFSVCYYLPLLPMLALPLLLILAGCCCSLSFFCCYYADRQDSFSGYLKKSLLFACTKPNYLLPTLLLNLTCLVLIKLLGSVAMFILPYLYVMINYQFYQKASRSIQKNEA